MIFIATSPIRRIDTMRCQQVKRRIRPVNHPAHQTMLERIDMDVIHVRSKIPIVANQVFPITSLPDATFAATHTGC